MFRQVPGPPRLVCGHQSMDLGEICWFVGSDWSGRFRNMYNFVSPKVNMTELGMFLALLGHSDSTNRQILMRSVY